MASERNELVTKARRLLLFAESIQKVIELEPAFDIKLVGSARGENAESPTTCFLELDPRLVPPSRWGQDRSKASIKPFILRVQPRPTEVRGGSLLIGYMESIDGSVQLHWSPLSRQGSGGLFRLPEAGSYFQADAVGRHLTAHPDFIPASVETTAFLGYPRSGLVAESSLAR